MIVAEHVNRRFFNVIHLLSNAIPIIAIQASLLEVNGQRCLSFTRILDVYAEAEDGTVSTSPASRDYWLKKSSWTLEIAEALFSIAKEEEPKVQINIVKNYLAFSNDRNFAWIKQRSNAKSLLELNIPEMHAELALELMDSIGLVATHTRGFFKVTVSLKVVSEQPTTFKKLIRLAIPL